MKDLHHAAGCLGTNTTAGPSEVGRRSLEDAQQWTNGVFVVSLELVVAASETLPRRDQSKREMRRKASKGDLDSLGALAVSRLSVSGNTAKPNFCATLTHHHTYTHTLLLSFNNLLVYRPRESPSAKPRGQLSSAEVTS